MRYLLEDLLQWLAINDPAKMPYWPGAHYTGGVGFRESRTLLELGASPIHLGVDRAGGGRFTTPFDGRVKWSIVGGAAGSLLRIIADDLSLELQVFHTEAEPYVEAIDLFMRQGDPLPVKPGDLGTSSGVHTHTEVLMPHTPELRDWLAGDSPPIIRDGMLDLSDLLVHCDRHYLDSCDVVRRVNAQVRGWRITELWPHFGARAALPEYRRPGWEGPTLHIDSHWLLKI
jgi:hypothetical protein